MYLEAAIGAAIYALVCLVFYLLQEKLVFAPAPPPQRDPSSLGFSFQNLELATDDGARVHAWWIPSQDARGETKMRGAVLVCHGNAGNIERRLGLAEVFARHGFGVLLFDYRGYGKSRGRPTEAGAYADAERAHAFLVREAGFTAREVVIFGESLGGAVGIELALRRPSAGLVVENTFTSIPDIGAQRYPWIPVRWLARVRFDSAAKMQRLQVPLLVVHSPDDEVVPIAHGKLLFERASEPKEFIETRGVHSAGGFLQTKEWRDRVCTFVDRALAGRAR